MRIGHRRGVAEGVIVGAAIAGGARRPPVAVVPAPMYYGAGASVAAAAATGAMYGAAAASQPPVIVNAGQPGYGPGAGYGPMGMPPNPGYYPPPAVQPAQMPYPPAPMPPMPMVAPDPMYQPAAVPPPYSMPPAAPPVIIEHPPPAVAPAAVPAVVAAEAAAIKAAEAVAVVKAFEKRPCFIVNEANCSLLEVKRGNAKPGAEVVLEKRHKDRPIHQQWYIDEHGVIRSCVNDFAIESKANGEHLHMMPFTGDARQKWIIQNNRIVNSVFCNDCIGLKKGLVRVKDDADVISGPYEGKPYQHWRIEYV